jgi:signal transduction histidine kinase
MLFVLIALWLIALLLIVIDRRSRTMRWMSAVAFTGGLGAMAAVIDTDIIPYVNERFASQVAENFLNRLQAACSLMSYYGLPYSYAMLALNYNPIPALKLWHRHLSFLLLLPAAACIVFTPGYTELYPISFPIVALWAIPYIAAGSILIASKKERLPGMQRTHLFTCLALLPPILSLAVLNYLLPSFGFLRLWVYHKWILAVVIPFFIFTFFKYGFLGMRLLIERRKLDSTLRAITSGTAILNHAIKNDVGKVRLFVDKMQRYAEETNQPELLQDLEVVSRASEHIREMISKVHEQTQDMALQLSNVQVNSLINEIATHLQLHFKQIKLTVQVPNAPVLCCDKAQFAETLTNLWMNAAEAMPDGGELLVKAVSTKKHWVLEIHDNGPGIDKATLKQVMEPFFTTKNNNRNNFGLGLAYCYNVMRKHGGTLELRSEPDKGTSVFLSFPITSLIQQKIMDNKEKNYGLHSTSHRGG